MLKKKIVMLGSFSVGKTSLVKRFVSDTFSDNYLTTVGVKIEQRAIEIGEQPVTLVLWDIHGDDMYQRVKSTYLRGSAGFFLVADGTRPKSLEDALMLAERFEAELKNLPAVLLLNKADLKKEWLIDDQLLERAHAANFSVLETSAKTGQGVEEAFLDITRRMLS